MSSKETEHEMHLFAPFEYIRKIPGKKVRSKLAIAFNEWMGIDETTLQKIVEIVEYLHDASILIDDIEDGSVLRRGLAVAHQIYGCPRTINSANYVYFVALNKCLQLQHPDAVKVFTEQLLELHRGQGKEIFWRDTVTCPTESDYEEMVVQKTGGLFFLAVRLMQLFTTEKHDFSKLLRLMAMFFQIRDDYMNIVSAEMAAQKCFAEDLTEGKFSYPLIHAIRNSVTPNDDEVLNILRQRTTEIEVKKYCIEVVKQRGSLEYTIAKLRELSGAIRDEVSRLGSNVMMMEVMALLEKNIDGFQQN